MNDKPDHQRPEKPDFWDKRFIEGVTPWNAGDSPAALIDFAKRCDGRRRTLIPGCGHAWEAGWLARLGWQVTALDFSPAAIAAARELLGNWPGELRCDDFFTYAPAVPFDIVYERAFLCALPRRLWTGYGARMHALIAPGGCIAGFFFLSDEPKGPPFGTSATELAALLSPWFVLEEDRPVPAADSIPVFAGRERWQVWRRRDEAGRPGDIPGALLS